MDKITITITNKKVIGIFKQLKSGTSRRFAVERAMEMLYGNPQSNELLFEQGGNTDKAATEKSESRPDTVETSAVKVEDAEQEKSAEESGQDQQTETTPAAQSVKRIDF